MSPDQVVSEWRHATSQRQYELRKQSLTVACPLPGCMAEPGHPCSYMGARIDHETGRTIAMERITRTAHLERLAVFTDGQLYGYTLRGLNR